MAVTWDSLEADLTLDLPLLHERFAEQKEQWEGDPIPQHVLMGDVFLPMLLELLRNDQMEEVEELTRFLELLAISDDVRLQEVVSVTVLEYLEGEPGAVKALRPHFGPGTLRLLEERETWRRTH